MFDFFLCIVSVILKIYGLFVERKIVRSSLFENLAAPKLIHFIMVLFVHCLTTIFSGARMKYYFAFHFVRCFSNWSFFSLYGSNYRISKFEFLDVGKCLPIYLGVPSYLLFSKDLFFVFLLLLLLVMFLQFMGVETNLNLFRTFLNFTILSTRLLSNFMLRWHLQRFRISWWEALLMSR